MDWDQISENWAAMTHRLRHGGTEGATHIAATPEPRRMPPGTRDAPPALQPPRLVQRGPALPTKT